MVDSLHGFSSVNYFPHFPSISDSLTLRHPRTNSPLVVLHGPGDPKRQCSTISFSLYDSNAKWICHWYVKQFEKNEPNIKFIPSFYLFRIVDRLATKSNISLRVGCFCNPGVAQVALRIPTSTLVSCVVRNVGHPSEEMISQRQGGLSDFVFFNKGINDWVQLLHVWVESIRSVSSGFPLGL
jgi:hypothetical protein